MEHAERRNFLKWALGGAAAVVAAGKANAVGVCLGTVPQDEGPFYPGESNILPINDLTRVEGATQAALGQVIRVRGIVRDLDCVPVEGANVEIWQACASGRYNHEDDPNSAPLDPHFRYWGEAFTNAHGEYEFKSILPGAYPASDSWDRPPHIHFRIAKRGYVELITQMYFKGQPLNDTDLILKRVPERLRPNVIVDFQMNPQNPLELRGQFDISIERL